MDARTLCLAVLARGEASGYEIKKALEEAPFSHFQDTSFGSIYPALSRLSKEGLVAGTELAQEKRPDKKVYKITDKGHAALIAALGEPPGPDRFRSDLLFILFHGDLLPPGYVAELIDDRLRKYQERIERMKDCQIEGGATGPRFVHGFGLAIYEAAEAYLRERRHEMIDAAAGRSPMVAE